MDSDSAAANRMPIEGAHKAAAAVQRIVDELSDELAGAEPEHVEGALHEKWTDTFGDAAGPLADEEAAALARHISEGDEVKIVPPIP